MRLLKIAIFFAFAVQPVENEQPYPQYKFKDTGVSLRLRDASHRVHASRDMKNPVRVGRGFSLSLD